MKKLNIYLVILGIVLFSFNAIGQFTTDCFFPKKGESSIAVGYTSKSYDTFYAGTTLAEGNPGGFGAIDSKIVSVYGTYSFSDKLTAVVSLPYISVKNESGVDDPVQMTNKVSALQDLSLGVKTKLWQQKFNNSGVILGAGAFVHFPISNYEEAGILSVGNGAFSVDGVALLHVQIYGGLFAAAQAGYSVRQNSRFTIPNAFIGELRLGYAHPLFYLATAIGRQNSVSSFDIGSEEFMMRGGPAILPETEVDYTVLNISGYVPFGKSGIGATAGYGKVLSGRNAGAESFVTVGIVVNGKGFNKRKEMEEEMKMK